MDVARKYPSLAPGEVIAERYKLVELIGEGGMGMVFLAEHVMIKRRVAIKILHPDLSTDAMMVKRFLNEARAAGTLGHPNIVESMDMGVTSDNFLYIVFEYIDGSLLSDEIYRSGGMQILRALHVGDQVAAALGAAHAAGIVHRDLKSDNVFLSTKADVVDHVTVIDFGISRFLQSSQRTGKNSALLGTLEFMAPEQITTPEAVDHRADIYALGVMLYEMLAAKLPFQLATPTVQSKTRRRPPDLDANHALIVQIVQSPPPPLARLDAPPGLREMIEEKLLAKDPARRYQTMTDVRGALSAFASVMKAPPAPPPDETDPFGMLGLLARPRTVSKSLLDPAWLAQQIETLGARWCIDVDGLRLELHAPMVQCARVVRACVHIAEELAHHPRIVLDVDSMVLTTHTRQVNAITKLDLIYAARIEQWLRENGWA